jgi:hypothetical protein
VWGDEFGFLTDSVATKFCEFEFPELSIRYFDEDKQLEGCVLARVKYG